MRRVHRPSRRSGRRLRRAAARWLLGGSCAATLLLSSGCPAPEEPWIELGAGLDAWEPLGAEVELVFGPQGGWHVDVCLLFGGWGPDGLALTYRGIDAETGEQVTWETGAELTSTSVLVTGDGWERVGDRVVFQIDSDDEVIGRDLRLEVVATDGERELADEGTTTVVDEVP